ncbi:MAG: OmpA family protein [Bacteroidetes bacterium]|nr:OmpA family protein [Bacteroidota bacterium]
MKRAWIILPMLFFAVIIHGQSYSTDSKKAIKKFEAAVALYQGRDPLGAEDVLLKAISADDRFIEAYGLLSQICYESGRIGEAIKYYSRTLEIDPEGNPDGYRLLAGLMIRSGDYGRTLALLEKFLAFPPEQVNNRGAALSMKESCLFAINALENPVPFEPENLGDSVNSELNEYWPCLSVDEQQLMFTVMLPLNPGQVKSPVHEDFYLSMWTGSHWTTRENTGSPLNTTDNEGAHTVTADGRLLFFTACNRRDGKGQCDIYTSVRVNGNWSRPVNLGAPVNSGYSEKHPTVSADGRVLYFTSTRPGGFGSYDIWRSEWNGTTWSVPVNLGDSVNTSGIEQSPFLHPDQRSLYFSSTGWPGMGQGDLFFSRRSDEFDWSRPVNLGYPINTYSDEIGLSVNARGNRAYFASDREGRSNTDIFTFELPEEVRPVLVSYLRGRVYDSRNMKGVEALIQLIDLETEEVVVESSSILAEGEYLVTLPTDRDYALNVTASGYLFYSDHFAFRGEHSNLDPFRRDIPLERIVVGSSVVLNNIFFESDSHRLLPASLAELNRVVIFMQENPEVVVEISGHSDSTGSAAHNQELSGKRAGAVVEYLAGSGIAADRMIPAGYGDRKPVAGNDTGKGRAMNRRTELKITEIRQ